MSKPKSPVVFKRQYISGYPFYRVEERGTRGPDIPVRGWVEKDSLGEGWWSYRSFPNSDSTRHLYGSRKEATEALLL